MLLIAYIIITANTNSFFFFHRVYPPNQNAIQNCLLLNLRVKHTVCDTNVLFANIFYQKFILAGINDGGGHLGSSSQSSSRESKLAALPSDEKPDGDKLSGG